ncbi:MAG: hypothetical protein II997_08815 [Clostridia bacterium]|nr:hypothetical protein [Clostridia bacterium]
MKITIQPSAITKHKGGRIIPAKTPTQKAVATAPHNLYLSLKSITILLLYITQYAPKNNDVTIKESVAK